MSRPRPDFDAFTGNAGGLGIFEQRATAMADAVALLVQRWFLAMMRLSFGSADSNASMNLADS